MLRRDDDCVTSVTREVVEALLPGKVPKREVSVNRTANRHGWTRRVDEGVEITWVKELGKLAP